MLFCARKFEYDVIRLENYNNCKILFLDRHALSDKGVLSVCVCGGGGFSLKISKLCNILFMLNDKYAHM